MQLVDYRSDTEHSSYGAHSKRVPLAVHPPSLCLDLSSNSRSPLHENYCLAPDLEQFGIFSTLDSPAGARSTTFRSSYTHAPKNFRLPSDSVHRARDPIPTVLVIDILRSWSLTSPDTYTTLSMISWRPPSGRVIPSLVAHACSHSLSSIMSCQCTKSKENTSEGPMREIDIDDDLEEKWTAKVFGATRRNGSSSIRPLWLAPVLRITIYSRLVRPLRHL